MAKESIDDIPLSTGTTSAIGRKQTTVMEKKMSGYLSDENYANAVRLKISSTARSMLEGDLNFLSGARILASLRNEIPGGTVDQDFMAFVAIDSETDHFPLGETCQHWDKQSLERLQPEIRLAEERAKIFGSPACVSLLKRFGE